MPNKKLRSCTDTLDAAEEGEGSLGCCIAVKKLNSTYHNRGVYTYMYMRLELRNTCLIT